MCKRRGDSRRSRLQELDTELAATTKEESNAFEKDDDTCYSSDDNDSNLEDDKEDLDSTHNRTYIIRKRPHVLLPHHVHHNEAVSRASRDSNTSPFHRRHDLHDLYNPNPIDNNTSREGGRRNRRFRLKTPKVVKIIVWASRIPRIQWDLCPNCARM